MTTSLQVNPSATAPTYPIAVHGMANQVTFEGFVTRAWMHNQYRFLRLANNRPVEMGAQSDGPLTTESDYVTVRLDPSVYFDMNRAKTGLRVIVRGRIEGICIPETIGEILSHHNLAIPISREIAAITVTRPAVQIFGTSVGFPRNDNGMKQNQKHGHHRNNHRNDRRSNPGSDASANSSDTIKPEKPVPGGVQPGEDVSAVAAALDAKKKEKPNAKTTEPVLKKNAESKATTTKTAKEKKTK